MLTEREKEIMHDAGRYASWRVSKDKAEAMLAAYKEAAPTFSSRQDVEAWLTRHYSTNIVDFKDNMNFYGLV